MKTAIALFLTIHTGCLFAQLTETDTLPFSWRLSATGSWIAGNVDRLLLIGSADIASVHDKWALRSSTTCQYGTFGGFRTENDLISKNFFYLSPRRKVYPYLMGWLERNHRRDFAFRYQLGPGISWAIAPFLKISATATYEQTSFNRDTFTDSDNNGEKAVATFRGTLRLYGQHRLLKDKLRCRYEFWAQPSLHKPRNYRLHGDLAIELPVSRLLSFRTALNYNFEKLTLAGVEQQDIFWTFGLSITNFR